MKLLVEIIDNKITNSYILSDTLNGEKYQNELIEYVMEIAEFDVENERNEFLEINNYIIGELICDKITEYNDSTLQIIDV